MGMTKSPEAFVHCDQDLARRLERCESHANASFVDARASLSPDLGACWKDCGGTWAMFDGIGSPLTQTFGLGLFNQPDDAEVETLEEFFHARSADTMHEVCLLADPSVLSLLSRRGYRVIEWSQVLCQRLAQPMADTVPPPNPIKVRHSQPEEADAWAGVAALGWRTEAPDLEDFLRAIGQVNARAEATHCFFAELDGVPIAAGALHLHDGVALMAGASTIPSARGRGAQRALLTARLAFAQEAGCDLAMMVAAPGSTSQHNAQRAGFQNVYARIKWSKAAPTHPGAP